MTPISQMTIGEAISTVRDIVAIFGMVVVGWKARDIYQDGKDFLNEIKGFMHRMDNFAVVVMTNHLKHIETDLSIMSGRKRHSEDANEEYTEGYSGS